MDFWLKSYFEVKQRNGCLEMLGLHFLAKDPFKIMHPKYFQRTNFRSIGFQVNQNISEKNLRKLEAHLKTLLLYTNRSKNYLWRPEKKIDNRLNFALKASKWQFSGSLQRLIVVRIFEQFGSNRCQKKGYFSFKNSHLANNVNPKQ